MKKYILMFMCTFYIVALPANYTSKLHCAELYQHDADDHALITKILDENTQRKGLHKLIKKLDQDIALIETACKQKNDLSINEKLELRKLKVKIIKIKQMVKHTQSYQDERIIASLFARMFLM